MAKAKKPTDRGARRKVRRQNVGVLWPSPTPVPGSNVPSGFKISARSAQTIANTNVQLHEALLRLADK